MKYEIGNKKIIVSISVKTEHGFTGYPTLSGFQTGKRAKWRMLKSHTLHGKSLMGKKIIKLIEKLT